MAYFYVYSRLSLNPGFYVKTANRDKLDLFCTLEDCNARVPISDEVAHTYFNVRREHLLINLDKEG